ncbi:hypothetical protein [Paraburkholderia humisilvae]|nr:hypothetical protein [Paraburkholderia humisilvae]
MIQEYGLYLLIVLLVVCGIYVMYASSSEGETVTSLRNDLLSLSSRVKGDYFGQYGGVSTQTLIHSGVFKGLGSFSTAVGGEVVSVGGGYITVSPTMVHIPDDAMQYKIITLPDSACVPLIAGMQGVSAVVTVNSFIAKSPQVPFTPGNVQCSGDNNIVTFSIL